MTLRMIAPQAPAPLNKEPYTNMKNTTKRYIVFSKKATSKNGTYKSIKKFTTREEARTYKRDENRLREWGIFDVVTGNTVR